MPTDYYFASTTPIPGLRVTNRKAHGQMQHSNKSWLPTQCSASPAAEPITTGDPESKDSAEHLARRSRGPRGNDPASHLSKPDRSTGTPARPWHDRHPQTLNRSCKFLISRVSVADVTDGRSPAL
jgi:hypothetical protein